MPANDPAIASSPERRHADAPRESDLFRAIFSQSTAGIAQVDFTGRFVLVNARYCEIVGRTAEQLYGLRMQDITHPDDLPRNMPQFEQGLRSGASYAIEKRYLRPDGSPVWVSLSVSIIRDAAGVSTGMIAVAVDVTQQKEAEQALRESEQRFARFMHHLPGLAWIKDAQGRYVYANAAAAKAFGTAPCDLPGKTDDDLFPPETAAQFREHDRQALESGNGVQMIETLDHPDDERHHSLVSKFPIPGPDGEPALVGGMAIDITDRLRAEEGLRQSEERLRTLTDNLPSGFIYQTVKGPDGLAHFRYVSAGVEPMFGITPAEVERDPRTLYGLVHPEDAPRLMAAEIEADRTQKPFDCVFRAQSRTGELRWVHARSGPRRLANGHVAWEGVALDVTAHRMAEDALHDSEQQFHLLADSIPQLAWMARPDGWIFWYNRRWYEYTGTTPEQMEGWGWQSVHDPAELPRVVERFQAALASGDHWEDTFPLRRHDGQMRWHLSRALPVRDEQGRIVRWFGTNTDITERRAMEEALREADRRKDEFLAMLAHELRNPLAPVRSGLDLLALGEGTPEIIGLMRQQVMHLIRLVDDLLDVSRIMRGRIELRKEPVELAQIIAHATETARPAIDGQQHQFTRSLPPEPVWLEADPVRLAQVVSNLLTNAAKYTDRGGHIWLTAERQKNEVLLRVRDDGMGIDGALLPRVFDLFTQGNRALDRSQGGLGIGLTVVRSLVEMHGGTVSVHSDGPGHGTEFAVRLPVLGRPPLPVSDPPDPGASESRRILVVDDNLAAARMLVLLLRRFGGHEIRIAHDGIAAVDAAREVRPDLVLLDIGLPRMDGYEVARRLRQFDEGERMLLVALTGYGTQEDRCRSREAGFDEHLVKPPAIEELRRLFNHAKLGRQR